jgi:adenine-specific DNA-methyltransferase
MKTQKNTTKSADLIKKTGVHYTPSNLATFVAKQVLSHYTIIPGKPISILDPAVGDGELLIAVLNEIYSISSVFTINVTAFDIDVDAVNMTLLRLKQLFPMVTLNIHCLDFIKYITDVSSGSISCSTFDIVIGNPPYVRTQNLGTDVSQQLSSIFGLNGKIDLYHIFVLSIARLINDTSVVGLIVSNKFLSTKSAQTLRSKILVNYKIIHLWDLGDTKLFSAAVLPAVLLAKKSKLVEEPYVISKFTTIYSNNALDKYEPVDDLLNSLQYQGGVVLSDGTKLEIKHGKLDIKNNKNSVWILSNDEVNLSIKVLQSNTAFLLGDICKIKVGVKTTADSVFIRNDWNIVSKDCIPELLLPLITHHVAGRYKRSPKVSDYQILYPHISENGKQRAVNIDEFPYSLAYLNKYKNKLSERKYLIDAGRKWFEIWVPQKPDEWKEKKVVFRDIAEHPTFWLENTQAVINGDCYWFRLSKNIDPDVLYLCLAVCNSSFINWFYDITFNNRLYSGRRRFMTQYVEQFPIPEPTTKVARELIYKSKMLCHSDYLVNVKELEEEIDVLVWSAFGLNQRN